MWVQQYHRRHRHHCQSPIILSLFQTPSNPPDWTKSKALLCAFWTNPRAHTPFFSELCSIQIQHCSDQKFARQIFDIYPHWYRTDTLSVRQTSSIERVQNCKSIIWQTGAWEYELNAFVPCFATGLSFLCNTIVNVVTRPEERPVPNHMWRQYPTSSFQCKYIYNLVAAAYAMQHTHYGFGSALTSSSS